MKHRCRDANIKGRFKQKIGSFSKLHATSMTQNLPEIGRLPNLDVKMDKMFTKIGSLPNNIRRVGISADASNFGWNFLQCLKISWDTVLSSSLGQGKISWNQALSMKISWQLSFLMKCNSADSYYSSRHWFKRLTVIVVLVLVILFPDIYHLSRLSI